MTAADNGLPVAAVSVAFCGLRLTANPDRTPPALALVPPAKPPAPPERFLKAATVERFNALYPRLDPYACKAAFDAWAEGLPPEKQPRHYDRAFMGFAQKWIIGKLIVSNP